MPWINLLVFALLSAGHAELQVTLINRMHALPWSERFLKFTRRLHDLAVPLFPLALVWFLGLNGPRLLAGGAWDEVPLGWWPVLAVCGLGFVGLVYAAARWLLRRDPPALVSCRSRVVDLRERLGSDLLGSGPYRWMTRVPGNQIFQVEFNEKELALSGLPTEWDGLSLLHLSDFHFLGTLRREFFMEVVAQADSQPYDLVVFTGDLIDDMRCLDWLPETLGQLSGSLGRFFILGNHDWVQQPARIRQELSDLGWTDVAGRCVSLEHRGRRLWIGGNERPWMGNDPEFPPEGDAFRLLLSHTPDNLPWATRQSVDLMLSGHNHGGQVVLPIIGPVYSPSRYGVRYAAGCWQCARTLLHVSRGLSGKHPLRLNCRPEISRLILRTSPVDREATFAAGAHPRICIRG